MSSNERRDLENKIEALVIAIPREAEAHDFYMELSEQYEDSSAKEMFVFLAKQEEKHREQLEKILANLEDKLAGLDK